MEREPFMRLVPYFCVARQGGWRQKPSTRILEGTHLRRKSSISSLLLCLSFFSWRLWSPLLLMSWKRGEEGTSHHLLLYHLREKDGWQRGSDKEKLPKTKRQKWKRHQKEEVRKSINPFHGIYRFVNDNFLSFLDIKFLFDDDIFFMSCEGKILLSEESRESSSHELVLWFMRKNVCREMWWPPLTYHQKIVSSFSWSLTFCSISDTIRDVGFSDIDLW
jgi:hypothetical protein